MLGGLLSSAALGLAGLAQAAAPGVDELRVERGDEGLFLYAQLSFELAPSVQDALLKGIQVYFVAEARVLRERWYWFDQPVASASASRALPISRSRATGASAPPASRWWARNTAWA